MLYAFQLGPISTAEGEMTGFFAMTSEGVLAPRFGSATTALRSFAKESGADVLRCDASLGRAGKPLGFVVDEPPEWAAVARAILAFGLALGDSAPPAGSPIEAFLDAVQSFIDAEPWRYWDNANVIDVSVTRAGRTKTYEGCIMGAGGLEYGLALYPEKGSIARLSNATMREARTIDSIAVTVDDDPAWARDALLDGFGVDCVPVPIRLAKRRPQRATADDIATLAVALRAIASLRPSVRESLAHLDDEFDTTMTARVCAPPPARR